MTRRTTGAADFGQIGATATGTATYEIRVAGHLDDHWAATLGASTLVRLDDGTTSLTGPVIDQSQLHGVLARIRDLGVPLLTLRTFDRVGIAAESKPDTQPSDRSGTPLN
jgi:hypothetical protein